jgi:hypothetical protein
MKHCKLPFKASSSLGMKTTIQKSLFLNLKMDCRLQSEKNVNKTVKQPALDGKVLW